MLKLNRFKVQDLKHAIRIAKELKRSDLINFDFSVKLSEKLHCITQAETKLSLSSQKRGKINIDDLFFRTLLSNLSVLSKREIAGIVFLTLAKASVL